jgi:3-oxoadipate enol-lactonase
MTRMTRQHAEIAGRHLAWLQSGQGQQVVLLHAFPLSADMWQQQLDLVPHGVRLIAPDFRGLGESAGPPATSVDDHAEDVLALLRHLNIERAVIGGLSMGGYVAFALYRRAAQRFRALILADTQAAADTDQARAARVTLQQNVRDKGAAAAADAMIPKLLRPQSPATDRVREIILSNDANRAEGIINAIETLKTRPDSTATLALISCPTLIIVGADDTVTPVAIADTMRERIQTAAVTQVVIPDAAHLSNLEQPQAFNQALWEFVQKRVG